MSLRQACASDAVLLSSLHTEKVHVAGHSSGALISLQFAADNPAMVQSLALIERAPLGPFQVPAFAALGERFIGPAMAAFARADVRSATELFLRGVGGEHYQTLPSTKRTLSDEPGLFGYGVCKVHDSSAETWLRAATGKLTGHARHYT